MSARSHRRPHADSPSGRAPVTEYVAPAPDVTCAGPALADTRATPAAVTNVAPAPVIECIAQAPVAPSLQLPPAYTMRTVTVSDLVTSHISTTSVSQDYQEQIVTGETTQNIVKFQGANCGADPGADCA